MTPADRQLIAWLQARDWLTTDAQLAIGYLLARANGKSVTRKLTDRCERTLTALRTQRAREIAG
jgi:hypothetical protein